MMKKIAILGSTGSIGTQALDLCRRHPDRYKVTALTARGSKEKLFEQVREFRPETAGLTEGFDPAEIPEDLKFCRFLSGKEALHAAAAETDADMVLVSIVGIAGLQGVMDALKAGKQVLLANKEALVTGGHLVTDLARKAGKPLLPVDSEHSAIFQCLQADGTNKPVKILLTASGGPFRTWDKERIRKATKAEALKHPNWNMGAKITVDSATMMNKGLEVIEASWLFSVAPIDIRVVVHPQSVLHSAVEFRDGCVIGQMGLPDMKMPIAYALSYPDRLPEVGEQLSLIQYGTLTFERPDLDTFRCLALAYRAIREGGSYPIVLNAANEEAVSQFLSGQIGFCQIADRVEAALDQHENTVISAVGDILEVERKTREYLCRSSW